MEQAASLPVIECERGFGAWLVSKLTVIGSPDMESPKEKMRCTGSLF